MNQEMVNLPESALIDSLRDSQLCAVQLDPQRLTVSFRFTFGPDKPEIIVELENTAHIVISKDPNDEESLAIVGEAKLLSLRNGGALILERLRYPFRRIDDQSAVLTYPSALLYHFHLEGDICADIVCGSYSVRVTDA